MNIFSLLRGVELRHFSDEKCLEDVWVLLSYALVYKMDFRILNKELRRAFKLDPLSS